ncbi:type II toxin-antitoxin system YafO family toxin [Vibrio harveyi]|uniref:type II toxin-antitoxin system YafO family toxin n=1 Tax=Vibrio harveyi TaxID=669 RepID=UPI0006803D2F|nr:type II toxin-antitoxin system YafO family toxin [Vibrio harveyi]ELI0636756.1 type II toxin-antitoxin system YafO family toxin [Vibrio harveyi]MDN4693371.1 type II toxin-antitoxin system YafO family toxin [Vibrio parahaemolyticus]MDN4710267.1 type II toxin-antitoxin system YafO family toxin [Vibrio parahaemolyticus]
MQEGLVEVQEVKVKIVVDRDLEPLNPQREKLKAAFAQYKEISLAKGDVNFITPPIGVQMTKVPDHPSFGRDTEFEEPRELINEIFEYNLSKVHVDTRAAWKPTVNQWYCTSNESIVYSGFKMPCGTYCFVIIDFLVVDGDAEFNSHNHYKTSDIDNFLDIAHDNRETILSEE